MQAQLPVLVNSKTDHDKEKKEQTFYYWLLKLLYKDGDVTDVKFALQG